MADYGPIRVTAPLVVACWGVLNGLMTALLAGMGGDNIELILYGSAVIVVELLAAAVALSRRWRPAGPARRAPPGGATALWLAVGAAIAGLGLAFGFWVSLLSVPPFIAAAASEAYIWHKKALVVVTDQVVVGAPAEGAQPRPARAGESAGPRAAR